MVCNGRPEIGPTVPSITLIGSQKKMQEFLSKHVDSYMDPQTGYSFKVQSP